MHHLIGIDSRRTPTGFCIYSQGALPLENLIFILQAFVPH